MCNLYQVRKPAAEIASLFAASIPAPFNSADETVPGWPGMVVREDTGSRIVQSMTWGFPLPQKSKRTGLPIKPIPVNSVRDLSKPMWRGIAPKTQWRCLIPVTRFAEAEGEKGSKTRTWFSLKGHEVFAWAGFWRESAEWGPVYTGMMTDCNEAIRPVHDRMPVLLMPDEWDIPADFAPALILDASGRVRETYRTMEAAGHLKRLPAAPMDYSNLRIHHWDRAASRSAMDDPKARQEVLEAVAAAINETATDEPWLVIYHQDRDAASYSLKDELRGLVVNPSRLSWLHWGNHHGTNDYQHIRKVIVIGLWLKPPPYYSALHVASGGLRNLATDKATLDALKAGENQHNLLQAICRASVRKGSDGVCGACEVHVVGKLGNDARQLLVGTFPGAMVDRWTPAGHELTGSALRVARELERAFSPPGVQKVPKSALQALLGFRSSEALAKVTRRADFRDWVTAQGWQVATRAFELAS